MLQIFMVNGE